MKQPPVLVKAAAIATSVLLATGLISYRAGAFRSFMRPAAAADPAGLPSVAEDTGDAMFGSSKSDLILSDTKYPVDVITVPAAPGTTQPDLTIMYSSKAGPAFTPAAPGKSGTTPPATSQPAPPPSGKAGPKP
jgi:hypothetical protein